jgi:hypothetical protein
MERMKKKGKMKTASKKQIRDKLLRKPLTSTRKEMIYTLRAAFE